MGLLESLFSRKEASPHSFVWIGLDFGTATTECVLRFESRGRPDAVYVMAFDGVTRRDAKVVLPSAMEIRDDKIVPSFAMSGHGHIVEMLKTKLIAELDRGVRGAALRREDSPFGWIMLHLASVLSVARSAVVAKTRGRKVHYYLNIAAPVGADETCNRNVQIRELFRELGFRALVLSSEWPKVPPSKAEAVDLYRRGIELTLPSAEQSPVFAVPEALAAVTSFLHAPNRTVGNYATIDVGGGTTDISVFWFKSGQHDSTFEKKALYYSVRSTSLGTNDLIQGLKRHQVNGDGITAHQRLRHMSNPGRHIHPDALKKFTDGIDAAYRKAFEDCWDLRPWHPDWCKGRRAAWTLLLLGGGSSFEFVKQHLAHTPPANMNVHEHDTVAPLEAPAFLDILLPSGAVLEQGDGQSWQTAEDAVRANGALLTVAYGLASRAPDIPKYGMDSPIKPPPPPPPWEPPPHTEHN